jgi:hypothetical protein
MTRSKKRPLTRARAPAPSAQTTNARASSETSRAETFAKPAQRPRVSMHLKATAQHRRPDVTTTLSVDERRAMIEQAAYFRAEGRGFAPGHELEDWVAAELEVDQFLTESTAPGTKNTPESVFRTADEA